MCLMFLFYISGEPRHRWSWDHHALMKTSQSKIRKVKWIRTKRRALPGPGHHWSRISHAVVKTWQPKVHKPRWVRDKESCIRMRMSFWYAEIFQKINGFTWHVHIYLLYERLSFNNVQVRYCQKLNLSNLRNMDYLERFSRSYPRYIYSKPTCLGVAFVTQIGWFWATRRNLYTQWHLF